MGRIWHTLRKPAGSVTRQAISEGKRTVGRPKGTGENVENLAKTSGLLWVQLGGLSAQA